MGLFDKIKKPDLSGIGQIIRNGAEDLAEKGKSMGAKCADGFSSSASFIGNLGQDVASNVANGVRIASESVANSAAGLQKKFQDSGIKGMFDSIGMSNILDNISSYGKNFNESSLWKKVKEVAAKVGGVLTYNVMLLLTMATSSEVSLKDKALIFGALGYFILPMDGIPDIIAGIGYLDDMGSIAYVLGKIQSSITPEIEREARAKTEKIFGRSDESWFVNPEDAAHQAKEAKNDLDRNLHSARALFSSLKK